MFETAVVAFRRFLVAAVFVYVSFYGLYVLLFALELFQLRRGGFVCSGNLDGFIEGKLFALLQKSWIFLCFVPTMSCSISRSPNSILSLNLHFEA